MVHADFTGAVVLICENTFLEGDNGVGDADPFRLGVEGLGDVVRGAFEGSRVVLVAVVVRLSRDGEDQSGEEDKVSGRLNGDHLLLRWKRVGAIVAFVRFLLGTTSVRVIKTTWTPLSTSVETAIAEPVLVHQPLIEKIITEFRQAISLQFFPHKLNWRSAQKSTSQDVASL